MPTSTLITGNSTTYYQIDSTGTVQYQLFIKLPIGMDGFFTFNSATNFGDVATLDSTLVYNKTTNVIGVDTTKFATAAQGALASSALQTQVNADWSAPMGPAMILNKPTIPAAQVNADWNAVSGVAQILNKPTIPGASTINDGVSRSIVTSTSSTGFQVSSTRPTYVNYKIDTSSTSTIAGSSSVVVYLETANTNSTTPSDWTIIDKATNSQVVSLAVALQVIQNLTLKLDGNIPAGKWVRIRSVVTGTGSATYYLGQETIN